MAAWPPRGRCRTPPLTGAPVSQRIRHRPRHRGIDWRSPRGACSTAAGQRRGPDAEHQGAFSMARVRSHRAAVASCVSRGRTRAIPGALRRASRPAFGAAPANGSASHPVARFPCPAARGSPAAVGAAAGVDPACTGVARRTRAVPRVGRVPDWPPAVIGGPRHPQQRNLCHAPARACHAVRSRPAPTLPPPPPDLSCDEGRLRLAVAPDRRRRLPIAGRRHLVTAIGRPAPPRPGGVSAPLWSSRVMSAWEAVTPPWSAGRRLAGLRPVLAPTFSSWPTAGVLRRRRTASFAAQRHRPAAAPTGPRRVRCCRPKRGSGPPLGRRSNAAGRLVHPKSAEAPGPTISSAGSGVRDGVARVTRSAVQPARLGPVPRAAASARTASPSAASGAFARDLDQSVCTIRGPVSFAA